MAASRSGGDVVMVTKVGKDMFGELARENFKKEGLYSDYIFEDETEGTGTALIMVDDQGANSILVIPGACSHILDEEVDACREVLGQSGFLLTQLEVNMQATERMIRLAHEMGVSVVLNTAPVQPVSDEILSLVDVVTPNEVEASLITGVAIETVEDCGKAADYFFSKGVKKVVITWGEHGAYCNDGRREALIPVIPVTAVDTTGAGDAFSGGFITALSEGKDFFDAAVFGSVTAGLAVTRLGTAPAMPYREEIDEFVEMYRELLNQGIVLR